MADEEKAGTDWSDEEQDLIVADYYAMLTDELAGRPFVKARHIEDVSRRTGRSEGSVGRKYQNISAVLEELGLPRIRGYAPALNYQNALFDAIDRYLSGRREEALRAPPQELLSPPAAPETVFVDPPEPLPPRKERAERLERLVRKFDPAERDSRNRALGKKGEEFVLEIERRSLAAAGRDDLAKKVRWVSDEDGDGAGYDILSFVPTGEERHIEVKTTNGAVRTPFYLTRTECEVAKEREGTWLLYRVHQFAQEPRIFIVRPPLKEALRLVPETWRALPSTISINVKKRADCTDAELEAFCALAAAGGEVSAAFIKEGAEASQMLAFAYERDTLAGVAAIKNPKEKYRGDVFKKSGAAFDPAAYPFELGYVSVHPAFENQGLSKRLTKALLEDITVKIYATSATGKSFMHRTLERYGFKRAGKAYPSANDPNKKLFLFVRHP